MEEPHEVVGAHASLVKPWTESGFLNYFSMSGNAPHGSFEETVCDAQLFVWDRCDEHLDVRFLYFHNSSVPASFFFDELRTII